MAEAGREGRKGVRTAARRREDRTGSNAGAAQQGPSAEASCRCRPRQTQANTGSRRTGFGPSGGGGGGKRKPHPLTEVDIPSEHGQRWSRPQAHGHAPRLTATPPRSGPPRDLPPAPSKGAVSSRGHFTGCFEDPAEKETSKFSAKIQALFKQKISRREALFRTALFFRNDGNNYGAGGLGGDMNLET